MTTTSKVICTLGTSCIISAPPSRVWEILLDFEKYPEWNPFIREQKFIDEHGKPTTYERVDVGQLINVGPVHAPPTMGKPTRPFQKLHAKLVVTRADHENYLVSWKTNGIPKWILEAERTQSLHEEADGTTRYESWETFSGVGGYVAKYSWLNSAVTKGTEGMAQALKERAENTPQQ